MALSLDRKAFIDIITEGQGDIGGVMLPPPDGVWGMPLDMLKTLPGYDPDVRRTARKPARSWRSSATAPKAAPGQGLDPQHCPYRDPAVILIDQLKQIYIDAELETVDTTHGTRRSCARISPSAWWSARTASTIRTSNSTRITCAAPSETTAAIAIRELDELIDRQSMEPDREKRRQLVWEIERRLAEDNVRPIIFYARQATCRQPRVKGLTLMVNSIYNGSRFEDLWLDQ